MYIYVVWNICLHFPPGRTWHKVNGLKVDYSGDLEEGKVGHESRLEPCWIMLVIDSFHAMWALWALLDHGVQCETRVTKGVTDAAHLPKGDLAEAGGPLASSLPLMFNAHLLYMYVSGIYVVMICLLFWFLKFPYVEFFLLWLLTVFVKRLLLFYGMLIFIGYLISNHFFYIYVLNMYYL